VLLSPVLKIPPEFSGAELEQAVISALYTAFAEGPEIKLQDRHLEAAFSVESWRTSLPRRRARGTAGGFPIACSLRPTPVT
jgi:hypothetical protein